MARSTAVICSYRLGMHDGVSVEVAKWAAALSCAGWEVRTVAGAGRADVLVPGLGIDDVGSPPSRHHLDEAFADAAVVIVENLCSLPINPDAGHAVAEVLRGRPTILHHHDLALERPAYAHFGAPPDDPAWRHVCVSAAAAALLATAGIEASVIYNAFSPSPRLGDREATRAVLGIAEDERLVLQPTRAIARKAVAKGLALAQALHATYWLTGPAEDGYDEELAAILQRATTRVLHRPAPLLPGQDEMAGAYAACDLVVLPSEQEGFGNPAVEAAAYRRPLALSSYPVAEELRALGFSWFSINDVQAIQNFLRAPKAEMLEANASCIDEALDVKKLPERLGRLLAECIAGHVSVPR